jgi:hypothetical protein
MDETQHFLKRSKTLKYLPLLLQF